MTAFFDFFSQTLYQNGDYLLTIGDVAIAILILLIWIALFQVAIKRWLPKFYASETAVVDAKKKRKAGRLLLFVFGILGLTGIVDALGLNIQLYPSEPLEEGKYGLFVNTILQAIAGIQFARLADWLLSNYIIRNYKNQRNVNWFDRNAKVAVKKTPKHKEERTAGVLIQSIVYAFTFYFLIRLFHLDELFPDFSLGQDDKKVTVTFSKIAMIFVIFFAARFFSWMITRLALLNYYRA
ncbi:MAG: hypothetical protein AAGI49_11890, partial [Bacteroidota bacterium]